MRKRRSMYLLAVVTLMLCLIAGSTVISAPKKMKLFFVPKFTGHIFFQLARDGAQQACKELNADLTYIGTTTADVEGQVKVFQNLVPQKPDAIISCFLDRNASAPTLKLMKKNGTTIVAFDDDVAPDARDLFVNMAPFEVQGQAQLESALYNAPEGGKVIWLAPTPNNSAFIGQKKGIDYCIEKFPRYKVFQFIDTLYMEDDPEKAYSVGLSAMQAHPDLRGFITGSGIANPAVNKAIEDSGRAGKVFCTGHAIPDTMKTFLDNGTCKQYALWSPYWFGYMSAYMALKIHNKTIKLKDGLTVNVPNIGARGIEKIDNAFYTNLNMMQFFRKGNDAWQTGLDMRTVLKGMGISMVK